MNPFHIGQSLTVQFGTRQRFTVAALRTGSADTTPACLMRFPHATTMSKWYSVTDLLRWNPEYQPKVHLLPAVCYRPCDRRNVPMERLVQGDVIFIAPLGTHFLVASIGALYEVKPFPRAPLVLENTRDAVLVNVVTGAKRIHQFRNIGHGTEHVEGRAG